MNRAIRRTNELGRVLSKSNAFAQGTLIKHCYTTACKHVSIEPFKSLHDEQVQITGSGLPPNTDITLHLWIKKEKENLHFSSLSHIQTSESGNFDTSNQPSVGGSYSGIDAMGPFWSVKPQEGSRDRLLTLDVTEPLVYSLEAYQGHLQLDDMTSKKSPLACCTAERAWMAPGVRRIPVREGRVRGTLFLPSGNGPHPVVITLYGGIHRKHVIEEKSAMLASHGIASFALAFFGVDDLPKRYSNLNIEYFEEAIDIIRAREDIANDGVGLLGISKGGDIALSMAAFLPHKIKAIVPMNGSVSSVGGSTQYKDHVVEGCYFKEINEDTVNLMDDNVMDCLGLMHDPLEYPNTLIPFAKSPCDILWIAGDDDHNYESPYYAKLAEGLMKDAGKTNYSVICYPGLGHLIDLPYSPPAIASFHPLAPAGVKIYMGGKNTQMHVQAQIDIWRKIIKFFKEKL